MESNSNLYHLKVVVGLILSSPKFMSTQSQNVTLFGNGPLLITLVKMRLFCIKMSPKSEDHCPMRGENAQTDMQGRRPCEDTDTQRRRPCQRMKLWRQECQESPDAGRGKGKISSRDFRISMVLLTP